MRFVGFLISRLRGLRRGYKFAILLMAAWAPLMLPEKPLFSAALMAVATAVFFIATGSKSAIEKHERVTQPENPDGAL
jgi:hypothetical protein